MKNTIITTDRLLFLVKSSTFINNKIITPQSWHRMNAFASRCLFSQQSRHAFSVCHETEFALILFTGKLITSSLAARWKWKVFRELLGCDLIKRDEPRFRHLTRASALIPWLCRRIYWSCHSFTLMRFFTESTKYSFSNIHIDFIKLEFSSLRRAKPYNVSHGDQY